MKEIDISIAIAKAIQFTDIQDLGPLARGPRLWGNDGAGISPIPNFTKDLNLMHVVEQTLSPIEKSRYLGNLANVVFKPGDLSFHKIHATAKQRAEAFLKTIGKWEQEPSE